MKKKLRIQAILRLGCGFIDYLLILLPTQLVLLGIMQQDASRVDFLFRLLFAVYGVLMVEYNHGATIGKTFGKLMVVDSSGAKATVMYVGLRELVRAMYMVPVAGWIACGISIVMMCINGRTLHDMVGNTRVIYRWEEETEEDEA